MKIIHLIYGKHACPRVNVERNTMYSYVRNSMLTETHIEGQHNNLLHLHMLFLVHMQYMDQLHKTTATTLIQIHIEHDMLT